MFRGCSDDTPCQYGVLDAVARSGRLNHHEPVVLARPAAIAPLRLTGIGRRRARLQLHRRAPELRNRVPAQRLHREPERVCGRTPRSTQSAPASPDGAAASRRNSARPAPLPPSSSPRASNRESPPPARCTRARTPGSDHAARRRIHQQRAVLRRRSGPGAPLSAAPPLPPPIGAEKLVP